MQCTYMLEICMENGNAATNDLSYVFTFFADVKPSKVKCDN